MRTFYRLFFIFQFSIFGFQFVHARKVTLPVHGLEVATLSPVEMDCEWDENWFFNTPTTKYNHGIARIAAFLSEISYVPVEKNPESNPMIESYRRLGFKDSDIEWNYILDYSTPLTGNNQAAYSFARKTVQTPEGQRNLVFVVLRGTPLSANEWLSNINVSDTTHKDRLIHEGFYNTVTNIHKALIYYLLKNKISPEESVFLITGHSRGAALANLLGATLDDEGLLTGDRLFVYTFAAPNISQEERVTDSRYHFIWNIVNAEDIVPSVPPDRNNWKWRKYGQTLVIVNNWNCNSTVYQTQYIPRMNKYFSRLLLRDYAPFKNGPFVHIQIARIFTKLYKTTEDYYDGIIGFHDKAEDMFMRIFPEKDENDNLNLPKSQAQNMPLLLKSLQKSINSNTNGGFDYAMNAFVDMHACETYLSWLLALEEDEIYSMLGSSQLVIKGSYDCAVYDDEGTLLARIINGVLELYSLKVPVAGLPLPNKNILGFPANQNLTVLIHKGSLVPTVIPYEIEHYDASGALVSESNQHYLFPYIGTAIVFKAGRATVESETVFHKRLHRKEAKPLIKKYELEPNIRFKIQPEFALSSEKKFIYGFRTGNQEIFASILVDYYSDDENTAFALSGGIGHQECLFGRIMLDIEGFSKFFWTADDSNNHNAAFVPTGRISVTFKPRHRVQFFMSGVWDMHIKGINDSAFDTPARKKPFKEIRIGDNIEFFPEMNFGIRF